MLTRDEAAGLLTAPGCPVCRHASSAGQLYLAWLGLEGHADASAVRRLSVSLGACARHTRRMMSEPGAGTRLASIYPHILREARDWVSGAAAQPARCPACEQEDAAADRALGLLLGALDDHELRDRWAALGGLCVPHLERAVAAGGRRTVIWLIETMTSTLSTDAGDLSWVAGGTGDDADLRAVLRRTAPVSALPDSLACTACLAAGHAGTAFLDRIVTISSEGLPDDADLLLCADHLADAATCTRTRSALASLLAWQGNGHVAARFGGGVPAARAGARMVTSRLRMSRSRRPAQCAACSAQSAAAGRALGRYSQTLRTFPSTRNWSALCVRHVLSLRESIPWAGQMIAVPVTGLADRLTAELTGAIAPAAEPPRAPAADAVSTAWRRAAVFLDGEVFCGRPPRRASEGRGTLDSAPYRS